MINRRSGPGPACLPIASLLLIVLAIFGCDNTTSAEETGDFSGTLDGPITTRVDGSAVFLDVDGVLLNITVPDVEGPCSLDLSVFNVRPADTLLTELEGTYAVTPDPRIMTNRRLVVATVDIDTAAESVGCPGFYRGRSGSVQVERTTRNRVEGTISIQATPDDARTATDTLTVSGDFSAVRRQVEG